MADEEKEIERIYVIPLRGAKHGPVSKAAPNAMKAVKNYLIKHMKVTKDNIWIDESINHELWSRGKYHIPSKIRVRAVKFDDGVVEASLPELGLKTSRRELLKEERAKKTPILRRDTEDHEEGEDAPGTEDFEIAPTSDGDVKIKKKKKSTKPQEEESKSKRKPSTKKETPKKKETKKSSSATSKKTPAKKTTPKKKSPTKK